MCHVSMGNICSNAIFYANKRAKLLAFASDFYTKFKRAIKQTKLSSLIASSLVPVSSCNLKYKLQIPVTHLKKVRNGHWKRLLLLSDAMLHRPKHRTSSLLQRATTSSAILQPLGPAKIRRRRLLYSPLSTQMFISPMSSFPVQLPESSL